jgi:putative transcriptional regulator
MNLSNSSHHPTDDQLIEFTAGTLSMSRSLCISAHLEFCPACRQRMSTMQQLGSLQLESLQPQKVSVDLKSQVLQAVKKEVVLEDIPPVQVKSSIQRIPKCLGKWVPEDFDNLDWSAITPSVSITELTTEGSGAKAALVKVKAGGKMAHHSHTGDEVTVILQGSYSDEDGCYSAGDFIFRDSEHKHKPIAAKDQDCICLIALDGPVQLTGWLSRLVNPLLRFNHRSPSMS